MNGIRIDSYLSDPTICKNAKGVESFFRYFLTTSVVIKNMEKKRIQSIVLIIKNGDDYEKNVWTHLYLMGNEKKEYDKLYTNDIQRKFWEIHNSIVWNYINETVSKIKSIN